MNIIPGIKIRGKSLWMPHERILIIADLHIGYEESLNKRGILVPRAQFEETKKDLEELFKEVKPKTIVINGDLKHEFGEISKQEWQDTFKVLDILDKNCGKIILVKGNHDSILLPIIKKINKKKIKFVDNYIIEDICILHGHKLNMKVGSIIRNSKTIIIAHEHPAISMTEGARHETYKCFLLGKWRDKKMIVMPSFLPIVEGSDIRKEEILSPFLKQNLTDFDVFVVSDKVYEFGKLGKLRK